MWNYQDLEVLEAVIDFAGFQNAAKNLNITQSAVSQRIRNLEELVGSPVVLRTTPPSLTPIGELLYSHIQNVKISEQKLNLSLESKEKSAFNYITFGVNDDSLNVWFIDAIKKPLLEYNFILDLIVENEDVTFERLKSGKVLACVSTSEKRLAGCDVAKISSMKYLMLATVEFRDKYFAAGLTPEAILTSPAILYEEKDFIHSRFLKEVFKKDINFPYHKVPSSLPFYNFIVNGLTYGMVPVAQAREKLDNGCLINLVPNKFYKQNLFLHFQRSISGDAKKLISNILKVGRKTLKELQS